MRKSGEYDDIEALMRQLVSVSKTSRKIEINATHEDGTRDMWIMGWRGDMDYGYFAGLYVPNPTSQRRKMLVSLFTKLTCQAT
jgi:hypothetical protein